MHTSWHLDQGEMKEMLSTSTELEVECSQHILEMLRTLN